VRRFRDARLDEVRFADVHLMGASFIGSSFRGATFDRVRLNGSEFTECDLTEAVLPHANLDFATLRITRLPGARLPWGSLFAATLDRVDARGADLSRCDLTFARLELSAFGGANLLGAGIGSTFAEIDLAAFCEAPERAHIGPSYVDLRSVLLSCRHPGLKRFLVDCGVPPNVAEFTIAAAEAEGDTLASLMRSTFISYGAPDEAFARRLYETLRAHAVTTFFFPESARWGRRIGDEVHSRIQEHDRVILVCSRASLDRPGVRNEVQETFDREARDGGATYLLPIMLDDYVLSGWNDPLAERVRDRVVGDFREATGDPVAFDRAMSRLLGALRKDPA
jgi:uncharacterized protein YjbI with pentapeptide repeats